MQTIKLKNSAPLRKWLDTRGYSYEVVRDGWDLLLSFHHKEDIFKAGIEYGAYCVSNPVLVTLEELQQRGDIPGF